MCEVWTLPNLIFFITCILFYKDNVSTCFARIWRHAIRKTVYDHHFSWHRQNLLGSLNTETSRASICRARPFLFHKYIMLYIKQGISSIIETLILNCYRLSSSSLVILVYWTDVLLPPNSSFIKYCYRNFKRVFFHYYTLLTIMNKNKIAE